MSLLSLGLQVRTLPGTPTIGLRMKLFISFVGLLLASPAVAKTEGSVTLGGTITEHGTSSESTSAEVITLNGRHEGIYDFNNTIQLSKGKTTLNLISGEAKEIHNISKNFYVIGDVRYDYDQFRSWHDTGVAAAGVGYRIIHTKNLKVSNELTTGVRATDFGGYAVVRESLWARYESNRVYAFTKLLFEKSNISYYRAQSGVNFKVTPKLSFGVQNLYSKDVKENDITSFNLGIRF